MNLNPAFNEFELEKKNIYNKIGKICKRAERNRTFYGSFCFEFSPFDS